MTATASTEDARTPEPPEPVAEASGSGVIVFKSGSSPKADKDGRVPVFSINGTVYTMRTQLKTNERLTYVHLGRTRAPSVAHDYVMETMLGDGWRALMAFPDLTEEGLSEVIASATRIMTTPRETPDGAGDVPAAANGSKRTKRK